MTSENIIDREIAARHQLLMTCTDDGRPPLNTSVYVIITVDDVNDHAPVFTHTVYNATVRENSQPLEVVIQVSATDVDDKHSSVVYTLIGADGFAIDRNSGTIWTNASFDREQRDVYEFYVTASNSDRFVATGNRGGAAPNYGTSTATVLVRVLDENDQPPRFTKSKYTFEIGENMAAGSTVGHVSASDADLPPHNRHSYYLEATSGGDSSHLFGVDPRTGRMFTRRPLDREDSDTHRLVVSVRDDVIQTLRDQCDVTVYVTDDNDHAPLVTFPTQYNDTVYVVSTTAAGTRLTRIVATDSDSGDNARLWFTISQGNEHGLFRVDPNTGEVFLNGTLVQFVLETFRLTITVQDNGGSSGGVSTSLKTPTTLFIEVREAGSYVSEGGTQSIMSQLLQRPVAGIPAVVFIGLGLGLFVILVVVTISACMFRRQRRKERQNSQDSGNKPSPSSSTNTNSGVSSSSTDQQSKVASDGLLVMASNAAALTPAASSVSSSSLQPGRAGSSAATTSSVFLEDEEWENMARLQAIDSLCRRSIVGPGPAGSMLPPLPAASQHQQQHMSNTLQRTVNCCESTLPWSAVSSIPLHQSNRYEPCSPATTYYGTTDRGPGLNCGPGDSTRLYGTVSRIGSWQRPAGCDAADMVRMSRTTAAGSRIGSRTTGNAVSQRPYPVESSTVIPPLALGDLQQHPADISRSTAPDWMTSSAAVTKSNFSNWLNMESLQLHQTGPRYRVADYGTVPSSTGLVQAPVTSSYHIDNGVGDVTRTRLLSDIDEHSSPAPASTGLPLSDNDVTGRPAAVTSSGGLHHHYHPHHQEVRKPIVINCSNSPDRAFSNGYK
jgi:hypothetical protein